MIRLQRAAELLAQKTGSVAEIAYFVDFSSRACYAKCFPEQFGCSPKEYTCTLAISGFITGQKRGRSTPWFV